MFRKHIIRVSVSLMLLVVFLALSPAQAQSYEDDAAAGWRYTGTWIAATGVSGAINSTEHWSQTASSTAKFTCNNVNAFTVYYSTAFNRGKAYVFVTDANGLVGDVETWDMYSASTVRQVQRDWYLSGFVASGKYTIHILASGLKNASSSGTFVSVDAINDC